MPRSLFRSVTAMVGAVAVLSAGIAPGWADGSEVLARAALSDAASVTEPTQRTWTETMAYRAAVAKEPRRGVITFAAPGARAALGERLEASATRVGAAPAPRSASALDGRITVQHGTAVRSVDVVTSALSTESIAAGYERPSWAPAGDRMHMQRYDAAEGLIFEELADDTGAHRDIRSHNDPGSVHEPLLVDQRRWSPFGDSVQAAPSSGAYPHIIGTNGYRFRSFGFLATTKFSAMLRHSPVINSYGDLALTVWSDTSVAPPVDRLSVAHVRFPDGVDLDLGGLDRNFDLALSSSRLGVPALGLEPGGDVTQGSADVLAIPAELSGGTASLLVDHADGRGPQSVATLGAICPGPQVAFAPSRTRLVYLKAVGPAGTPCGGTELWELTPADGRYDGGTSRRIASSGSVPFTNLTWKAETAPAFAGRLAGADRIGTAIATSASFHAAKSAPVVVLVNSSAFPDALAATPLAGRLGGPLLMTAASTLDPRTKAELVRVARPGALVYLVGGEGVLSAAVDKELMNSGFLTKQLGGASRFDTAVAVARELDGAARVDATTPSAHVLVADGSNFPDALVAGPAASQVFGVVVLTNGSLLPAVTAEYLRATLVGEGEGESWTPAVTAVGGPAARALAGDPTVRDQVVAELVGADRYATALMVHRWYAWPGSIIGVVDGRNWPDAVSGGVAMANAGGVLTLANGDTVPAPVGDWMAMTRSSTDTVLAFGGTGVVPDAAVKVAQQLAGRQSPIWGLDRP